MGGLRASRSCRQASIVADPRLTKVKPNATDGNTFARPGPEPPRCSNNHGGSATSTAALRRWRRAGLRRQAARRAARAPRPRSTSRATKASPMSRASTKAMRPSRTFLSWPISAISPSASGSSPGMSARLRLIPIAAEMRGDAARRLLRAEAERGGELEGEQAADRHGLAVQQPVRIAGRRLERVAEGVAEVQAARARPARSRRGRRSRPSSRRSAAPRSARAAGSPAASAGPFVSSQAKKPASPSRPYFTHLGVAGEQVARAAACRAARCRPAPGAAGGRRRPGSCRGPS